MHNALPEVSARGPEVPVAGWGIRYQVPKPLGLVLVIYEARPTVTIEGALLPVCVGNAVLLRGGKEIAATNAVLAGIVRTALERAGLPGDLVTVLDDPDRRIMRALLTDPTSADVLIPRGSPSLINYCKSATSIPVIASGGGANHLYVDAGADLALAAAIAVDSKVSEPTACNTLELVLVHETVAREFTATLRQVIASHSQPCALRLDPRIGISTPPLAEHDFGREFLEPTVGVLAVSGPESALTHIRRYGSGHTEGVISSDQRVIDQFVSGVDAAAIVINGSLRLHDGLTMELGPELSIATGRLHVRGPVGLRSLLTYSWVVHARGTLRDGLKANGDNNHVQ